MSTISEIGTSFDIQADPRHVFLSAREVMARYRWSKTKGYQNLKDRELVPAPVMTHPDRWRLDQLLAWEDRRIALAHEHVSSVQDARSKPVDSNRKSDADANHRLTALLPQPKQRRSA